MDMPVWRMVRMRGGNPGHRLPCSLRQLLHRGFSDAAQVEVSWSIFTTGIRTQGKPIKEAAWRRLVYDVVGFALLYRTIRRPLLAVGSPLLSSRPVCDIPDGSLGSLRISGIACFDDGHRVHASPSCRTCSSSSAIRALRWGERLRRSRLAARVLSSRT